MDEVGFVDTEKNLFMTTINNNIDISSLSVNEKINLVEKALFKLEPVEMPVTHSFTDGLYIRQFTIPKYTMLVSKYHKCDQFDIMITGKMSVLTNEGTVTITAPFFGVSKSGLKRLGYAHEDVVWIDVHSNPTNEKDIDKLEEKLYISDYKDIIEYEVSKYRQDFKIVLNEFNLTDEEVKNKSERVDNIVEIDLKSYNLKIAKSLIEGSGIFTTCLIPKDTIIAPISIGNLITQVGRYANHSCEPNAIVKFNSQEAWLVSLRTVENEEITIDYRQLKNVKYF